MKNGRTQEAKEEEVRREDKRAKILQHGQFGVLQTHFCRDIAVNKETRRRPRSFRFEVDSAAAQV